MNNFGKDKNTGLLLPRHARRGSLILPGKQRGFISMLPGVVAPYRDPRYSSVVSLLYMDGANNSTTFTDQKGNAWSRTGTAAITTSNFIFGGSSLNLPGAGSFISASGTPFNLNSSDYCVEVFFYITAAPGANGACVYTNYSGVQASGRIYFTLGGSGTISIGEQDASGSNTVVAAQSGIYSFNTWTYAAATKIGTSLSLYAGTNGAAALVGTATSPVRTSFTNNGRIGAFDPAGGTFGSPFTGQVGMVRVTKFGRAIGNVPTARYPNVGP